MDLKDNSYKDGHAQQVNIYTQIVNAPKAQAYPQVVNRKARRAAAKQQRSVLKAEAKAEAKRKSQYIKLEPLLGGHIHPEELCT